VGWRLVRERVSPGVSYHSLTVAAQKHMTARFFAEVGTKSVTAAKIVEMKPSPTVRLLLGLLVTLLAVATFSWYVLAQLHGLKELQADTIDRNRRDSLQLLRVQNTLSSLGMAVHDMVLGEEPYGVLAYKNQFERIRTDLDDAIQREAQLSPETRRPEQQEMLQASIRQFWHTSDQVFQLAARAQERAALQLAGSQLLAQQASLAALTSRLLTRNNEAEEQAATKVAAIYTGVERNVYAFLFAMLATIVVTSLYLIYSNRLLFERIETMSRQRRVLAARLIAVQEEVLKSISRELHDEFGQILTAVGAMLARAERKGLPPDSPFRTELSEVRQITQETLEKMRSLSQMLHPAVLDDYGLVKALEWSVGLFQKQTGIQTQVEVVGEPVRITGQSAIHCFRIVQEALNNAAKHAKTKTAEVTMTFGADTLTIRVRDHGIGIVQEQKHKKPGLGLIAMQERAELLGGTLKVRPATDGGTTVTLMIPLLQPDTSGDTELTPQEAASPHA
jgi:signal transduction histidine kinase